MSYEPLNLKKIKKLIEECARDYEVFGDARIESTFIDIRDHLKSAVQGLLQEIENRIKELDRYEQIGFTKQFYINCTNRRDEIETCIIPLIKKWFADVVEEAEE